MKQLSILAAIFCLSFSSTAMAEYRPFYNPDGRRIITSKSFNAEEWNQKVMLNQANKKKNSLIKELLKPKRKNINTTPHWHKQNVTNLGKTTKKRRKKWFKFKKKRKSMMDYRTGPLPGNTPFHE